MTPGPDLVNIDPCDEDGGAEETAKMNVLCVVLWTDEEIHFLSFFSLRMFSFSFLQNLFLFCFLGFCCFSRVFGVF